MSLLAPLYIAGLVAISLPILFHLIRRAPQSRHAFSSLMFLSTSPPRLTRRSRLTNILLLLLRAAALILLALAFARPFFQQDADAAANAGQGRRVALLVDTSASMRRADLWSQAAARAEEVLRDVTPADEVGLFFFDRHVRPGMTFAEWGELEPSRRAAVLRGRLAEAAPTWASTNLGEALATVADQLSEVEGSRRAAGASGRQLVLISDLQEGGHVEALQGHEWPENVLLQVKSVAVPGSTNAGLQLVSTAADDAAADPSAADARLRVRISNQSDSKREQFELTWANAQGPVSGIEPIKVYVPPGRNHLAQVPWPAAEQGADRLVLAGDDAAFDNTLYVVRPRKENVRVVFLGEDAADDPKGLLYYLRNAAADTPQRAVAMVSRRAADALAESDLLGARLVVVSAAAAIAEDRVAVVRRFAEGGGDVLCVLKDAAGAAASLGALTEAPAPEVVEAPANDFALVNRVELDHPLFAPFADPRYGDFTKIHFWKHRRLQPAATAADAAAPATSPAARVLAAFDDGDPFLIEHAVGRGRVIVATSGWHPADSQLALSSKFVPLIDGLLRPRVGLAVGSQYAVGESIPWPSAGGGAAASASRIVIAPGDGAIAVPAADAAFAGADAPGVYRLRAGDEETPLAVNVAADESRTAPLAAEELERWGAKLGDQPTPEEIVTRQRQLQRVELEGRQKVWQWLIVGVLGLLGAETAVAGLLARRAQNQQVTT